MRGAGSLDTRAGLVVLVATGVVGADRWVGETSVGTHRYSRVLIGIRRYSGLRRLPILSLVTQGSHRCPARSLSGRLCS